MGTQFQETFLKEVIEIHERSVTTDTPPRDSLKIIGFIAKLGGDDVDARLQAKVLDSDEATRVIMRAHEAIGRIHSLLKID